MPDMELPLQARLQEMSLGGCTPAVSAGSRGSKLARLTAAGWRILPIPEFWAERQLWYSEKDESGNPAFIDFFYPHEWLVIPPDALGLPAQKVRGRIRAIRWAWERRAGARCTG